MRTLFLVSALVLVAGGCKKKSPEPAPEAAKPAVVDTTPADPRSTLVVQVRGEGATEKVKVICKSGAVTQSAPLVDGHATITGLTDTCTVYAMPSNASFGPVDPGTTLNCILTVDNDLNCK